MSLSFFLRSMSLLHNLTYLGTEQEALPLSMYLIGYSVGPFFVAPLSETYGRRPLFIAGLVCFTAFMAATGASPNYGSLLAFRFLSGVSGAVPMTKYV